MAIRFLFFRRYEKKIRVNLIKPDFSPSERRVGDSGGTGRIPVSCGGRGRVPDIVQGPEELVSG